MLFSIWTIIEIIAIVKSIGGEVLPTPNTLINWPSH